MLELDDTVVAEVVQTRHVSSLFCSGVQSISLPMLWLMQSKEAVCSDLHDSVLTFNLTGGHHCIFMNK